MHGIAGCTIRGVARDTVISFKVDRAFKAKLSAVAAAEHRSLSNFIEKVLKEELDRRDSRKQKTRPSQ
jgi:predicted transcriptional regulator